MMVIKHSKLYHPEAYGLVSILPTRSELTDGWCYTIYALSSDWCIKSERKKKQQQKNKQTKQKKPQHN
jgi:hypothetical protein